MTMQNLGTVFGPTILRDVDDDPQKAIQEAGYLNQVIEALIANYAFLFQTDAPQPSAK